MGKLLNSSLKLCTGRGARVPGDRQRQLLALQGTNSPAENTGAVRPSRRQPRHGFGPTCGLIPHPQVGPGATVGTLRQEYPLLQDKDEGAQERQPRTTGPDPRGQVPNLRGPDLGLYKWKPDLQEA